MKNFLKRVALALCTGYIVVYYGELMFWATPDRKKMDLGELLMTWLIGYTPAAYLMLCVAAKFRARNPWAVFLVGAFFGWLVEGVIAMTTTGTTDAPFPLSIPWTALAWHALIDVWIGWYWMRRVLAQNRFAKTAVLAAGIGLFYGAWAIFWWNEPAPPMKAFLDAGRTDIVFIHFAAFSFLTTLPLIASYWLWSCLQPFAFQPSKVEIGVLSAIIILVAALFGFPALPQELKTFVLRRAPIVLPPLFGITLLALNKNRRTETQPDATTAFPDKVKRLNYWILLLIPLVASVIYFLALAANAKLPTNFVVLILFTLAGTVLWIVSLVKVFRAKPTSPAPLSPTLG